MLKELLIFIGLICSEAALLFVIILLFPVVWHADIKPLIDEMLGPHE